MLFYIGGSLSSKIRNLDEVFTYNHMDVPSKPLSC